MVGGRKKLKVFEGFKERATSEILINMEQEIKCMLAAISQLKAQVGRDDLTGLLRRNEFFQNLATLKQMSHGTLSLIMIDIDNFKALNDREGHQVGDHTLQRVAEVLCRSSKAGAVAGRFGGEEFIVAISGSRVKAEALAEALRRQIAKQVGVTVSIGIASAYNAEFEADRVLQLADEALYEAKRTGKNRVCLAAAA